MEQRIQDGARAVDATMGNGHDTLRLAQLVGERGKVSAFDIQQEAIHSTRRLLEKHGLLSRVELYCQSHSEMDFPDESVDFVVFNLGYLPRSDKTIATKGETTIQAVEKALRFIKVGGLIVLVVYWGHEQGKEEKRWVERYVEQIPYPEFIVLRYEYVNPKNFPPFVFAIERRK